MIIMKKHKCSCGKKFFPTLIHSMEMITNTSPLDLLKIICPYCGKIHFFDSAYLPGGNYEKK